MINSKEFLQVMSLMVKELGKFSSQDFPNLLHLLTVQIDWRDSTLHRMLEAPIMESLPQYEPSQIIMIIESYSAVHTGSRSLWESLVASATSLANQRLLSSDEVIRLIRCINMNRTFYKPIYLLTNLSPLIEEGHSERTVVDMADIMTAYCTWPKSLQSKAAFNHFLDSMLHAVTKYRLDIVSTGKIMHALPGNYLMRNSLELIKFVEKVRDAIITEQLVGDDIQASKRGIALVHIIQSLYKYYADVAEGSQETVKIFTTIERELTSGILSRLPPSKYAVLAPIYCKSFGLTTNSGGVNFGPSNPDRVQIGLRIEDQIPIALIKSGMRGLTIRELARLGEAFACIRLDMKEFWAAYTTVLESSLGDSDGGSELSPEEIAQVLYTIMEMNLGESLSRASLNQIALIIFEKINLMQKNFPLIFWYFYNSFSGSERARLIGQVAELADEDSLLGKWEIVGNMVLSLISEEPISQFFEISNKETIEFWLYCRSVIDPIVLNDMKAMVGDCEADTVISNCLIDFLVPQKYLAILVHSPSQLIGGSIITGTGLLREASVRKILPDGWTVAGISSVEWVEMMNGNDLAARQKIIAEVFSRKSHCEEEVEDNKDDQSEIVDDRPHDDLSPYIQKDRIAAHRRRAPPATSLPWVPSVFSLKQRRRPRRPVS
jgi:hypothetical protein